MQSRDFGEPDEIVEFQIYFILPDGSFSPGMKFSEIANGNRPEMAYENLIVSMPKALREIFNPHFTLATTVTEGTNAQ